MYIYTEYNAIKIGKLKELGIIPIEEHGETYVEIEFEIDPRRDPFDLETWEFIEARIGGKRWNLDMLRKILNFEDIAEEASQAESEATYDRCVEKYYGGEGYPTLKELLIEGQKIKRGHL